MKDYQKGTPKGEPKQKRFAPRPLDNDEQLQVEAIEQKGGNLANAAINFWHGINYAQPFLANAIKEAMTRAAVHFGLADPATTEISHEPIEQLERLYALYEVTGEDFELTPELSAADHLRALIFHDDTTQELSDLLVDYLSAKVKATGLEVTEPPIADLAVIKMVLAAERAAELERRGE
jgi:hypothetical protein